MSVFLLALPALGYVILQFVALDRLRGAWRKASFLSSLLVATLVIVSLAGQLIGWSIVGAGLDIAVPAGLFILTALLFLSEAVRVFPFRD